MEDILEEIVGDILDEYDIDSEEIKQISENKYIINGRMSVNDFCDYFNIEEFDEDDDYDTVAGLVFDIAGEVPKIGDEFIWNNFKFIIKRLENRRIDLMEVEILGGRSKISPTISSKISSIVIIPAVPPYSSTTTAICSLFFWNSLSIKSIFLVSGTNKGLRKSFNKSSIL